MYDRDFFLRNFHISKAVREIDRPSEFGKLIPRMPTNLGDRYHEVIIPLINQISMVCAGRHLYFPPAHTLRPYAPNGLWFTYLDELTRDVAINNVAPFILQCLQDARFGYATYEPIRIALSLQVGSQGFGFISNLMVLAMHPTYVTDMPMPPPPVQTRNDSFIMFYHALSRYTERLMLDGIFLNERWFIEMLVTRCQRDIGRWLQWLIVEVNSEPRNAPLPLAYTPKQLIHMIHRRATLTNNANWMQRSPAQLLNDRSGATPRIHALTPTIEELPSVPSTPIPTQAPSNAIVPRPPSQDNDMSEQGIGPAYLELLVNALRDGNNIPNTCYVCRSPDHRLSETCPTIRYIKRNPNALRRVLQLLNDNANGRDNRNRRPPNDRAENYRRIRALLEQPEAPDEPMYESDSDTSCLNV